MLGPLRLVTRDLGTQMAFVLARGEPITFLAQVSFLGILSKFESIDELSLRVLSWDNPYLDVPFLGKCSKCGVCSCKKSSYLASCLLPCR